MVLILSPQSIRGSVSKLMLVQDWLLLLLGCAAGVDTYLRLQIALETVDKFIIRTRRGEAINILGDRIWNILFLLSPLLVLFLIGRGIACSFSRCCEDETAKN